MTTKLVQKLFLKGTREFEIGDDAVYVRIKGLLKQERLTVSLSMLDPEPVVNGTELEFHGRAHQGPMLSLILNNPDTGEFNAFLEVLRQKILEAGIAFAGSESASSEDSQHDAPGWNVYDEPPDFDEAQEDTDFQPVNPERLETDIVMLKTYLDEKDIGALIESLELLRAEPQNEAAFQQVMAAYNALGVTQGAVLTYATYLKILLSKSFWSE